jgi:cytochrome c peroxidase
VSSRAHCTIGVRLGRWLFYDSRLSADNSIACASCHKPEYAFSERTPVSTGIKGQKGGRKAPTEMGNTHEAIIDTLSRVKGY